MRTESSLSILQVLCIVFLIIMIFLSGAAAQWLIDQHNPDPTCIHEAPRG